MVEASVLKLDLFGGYQGGTEPWNQAASVKIDSDGFHETHLVGRSGDRAPLSVSQVADSLAAEFESASMLRLMGYVQQLHEALSKISGAARDAR